MELLGTLVILEKHYGEIKGELKHSHNHKFVQHIVHLNTSASSVQHIPSPG